jgi:hypothetical protein
MTPRRRGYILVETVTAMAILSISAVTVQRALQVAIHARGLAQDYTTAQILMDNLVAERSLQPRIAVGAQSAGQFPPPHDRFHFSWRFDEVNIPLPTLPSHLPPERAAAMEQAFLSHMGKLRVDINWSRAGEPVRITAETLFSPEQAWRDLSGRAP